MQRARFKRKASYKWDCVRSETDRAMMTAAKFVLAIALSVLAPAASATAPKHGMFARQ